MLKAMLSQPMPRKTDEEIVSWLNQHIFFESGYDITEGPFPLPATIGEGFRFQSLDFFNKNVVDYVTKASRKNGKRVLRFRISTFIGLCGGACHYFCKAYSAIHNTDVNDASHYISGYITDVDDKAIDIPSESRSLAFDIGVPLTKEMIQRDMGHYGCVNPATCHLTTGAHIRNEKADHNEQSAVGIRRLMLALQGVRTTMVYYIYIVVDKK